MEKKLCINWSQIDTPTHKAGMRLECRECGSVQYFGDSPDGDKRLYEARDAHVCRTEG